MKTMHFHGELIIVEGLTENISGKQLSEKEDVKLADSEVSGNDHMLQMIPGVTVFHDDSIDRFFVKASVDTKIYCKLKDRHDDLELKGGVDYTIFPAREYDHIRDSIRRVQD